MQDAIILLAGQGTRLKPLTDTTHKALIQVGGQSLLQRQLTALREYGVKKFHLVLGHRANDIRQYIQNHFADLDVSFYENKLFAQTNTGYSLWVGIQNMPRGFWLLDGDVIFDPKLLTHFCNQPTQNLLLCETDTSLLNAEAVKFCTNAHNHIVKIGKDIPIGEAAGESIGIAQFQAPFNVLLCDYFKKEFQNQNNWNWYYEDAFWRLMQNKVQFAPLMVQTTQPYAWVEIDDHDDLNLAKSLFE